MEKEGYIVVADEYKRQMQLFGPLNKTLMRIGELYPHIYTDVHVFACRPTPLNFAGSMFTAMHQNELITQFVAEEYIVPESLQNPLAIIEGVPLFAFNKHTRQYDDLQMRAPHVLAKYACGPDDTALILDGELSGMIVKQRTDVAMKQEGMYIARLINDLPIKPTNLPYNPNFYMFNFVHILPPELQGSAAATSKSWAFLDKRTVAFFHMFEAFLKELGVGPNTLLSVVELLFHQFKLLGIPFDEEGFHFTRDNPTEIFTPLR